MFLSRFFSNSYQSISKISNLLSINNQLSTNMSDKTALLLITDDSEEMEAVITADVLRRAGISLTIASITDKECVKCSRGIKICADVKLDDISDKKYDALILPGGSGCKTFTTSTKVGDLLKEYERDDKIIAAICAAPSALKAHNIAIGKQLTSYPSIKDQLTDSYKYLEDKVVIDGNLITSRGPATTFSFALSIVEKLLDKQIANKVASGMLYQD